MALANFDPAGGSGPRATPPPVPAPRKPEKSETPPPVVEVPEWAPKSTFWDASSNAWREPRWNWYVLPGFAPGQPGNHDGKGRGWQRVTTFIDTIEYKGDGLINWKLRHVLAGVLRSPDLMAQLYPMALELSGKRVMSKDDYDEQNAAWEPLFEKAMIASGGNEGKRNGKEIHFGTELLDKQEATLDTLPTAVQMQDDGNTWMADISRWRGHLAAYIALRDGLGSGPGFQVFREFVERTMNPDPDLGCCGTADRLVLFQAPDAMIDEINNHRAGFNLEPLPYETEPQWTILDVKSGDVDYRDKMGRQMAIYAHAQAFWNFDTNEYEPLPDNVNRDYALVVNIPWWEETDPVAELIPVPFLGLAGVEGLDRCLTVKNAKKGLRSAPKLKSIAIASSEPAAPPALTVVPQLPDADPTPTWEQRIHFSNSKEEVKQVRTDAIAKQEWTPELLEFAKAKMKSLAE